MSESGTPDGTIGGEARADLDTRDDAEDVETEDVAYDDMDDDEAAEVADGDAAHHRAA